MPTSSEFRPLGEPGNAMTWGKVPPGGATQAGALGRDGKETMDIDASLIRRTPAVFDLDQSACGFAGFVVRITKRRARSRHPVAAYPDPPDPIPMPVSRDPMRPREPRRGRGSVLDNRRWHGRAVRMWMWRRWSASRSGSRRLRTRPRWWSTSRSWPRR